MGAFARLLGGFAWLRAALTPDRERLGLWTPVIFGLGIWAYFAAEAEPSGWAIACAIAAAVIVGPAAMRARTAAAYLLAIIALASAGFAAAAIRAHVAAAPMLSEALDATVEGRVAELSRSRADQLRAELSDVVIYGLPKGRTPERVRLALLQGDFSRPVRVGDRIAVYARLSPPGAPVEPGGFDFRRHAWFDELGAVGYARGPAMLSERRPPTGLFNRLGAATAELRDRIAVSIGAQMPGETGAFAAAILVGSRAEIGAEPLQALRDSNLAHLLAISGLHMGLLAGIVFGAVRGGLALVPGAAQRFSTKKAAAIVALVAATGYLALSGASVATQRAWVMAAAALIAILIDRPAISLRALAAAAMVILLWRPESLLNAGFQMSFAAALALVAAWESPWGRVARRAWSEGGRASAVSRWVLALALTSLIAGIATSPFAAMSFNRMPAYGLVANMLAVPAMGLVAMPAAAVAGVLAPFGLEGPALAVMGWAIDWILFVARWASDLPGAVRPIPEAPMISAALITFGGLFLCLCCRPTRALGLAPAALGLALWAAADRRPTLLVAPEGAAIGLMGPDGRAVDRARGQGYAIESWLAADGDAGDQSEAASRPGLLRQGRRVEGDLGGGWTLVRFSGRARVDTMSRDCTKQVLLIAPAAPEPPVGPCVYLGPERLAGLGALSVEVQDGRLVIRSALQESAGRIWTRLPGGGQGPDEDVGALFDGAAGS
ncbi:ComEC/Rec2 family competence protein [Rhodovulum sp. DZ06]|uniref:ComEC/Rec2 family competence protein n=1 Tax=Rhodovulum sp. DZ06 TaxID=3425126 RepID=UPI003D331757